MEDPNINPAPPAPTEPPAEPPKPAPATDWEAKYNAEKAAREKAERERDEANKLIQNPPAGKEKTGDNLDKMLKEFRGDYGSRTA